MTSSHRNLHVVYEIEQLLADLVSKVQQAHFGRQAGAPSLRDTACRIVDLVVVETVQLTSIETREIVDDTVRFGHK